jgi:hypothetical protein
MTNSSALTSILTNLQAERAGLADQLTKLDAALSALGVMNGGSSSTLRKRTMSDAGRRRISLAQKRRWAKVKGAGNAQAPNAKSRRTMSASARRKIAAAQRARWAKVRAGKKKAA